MSKRKVSYTMLNLLLTTLFYPNDIQSLGEKNPLNTDTSFPTEVCNIQSLNDKIIINTD